MTEFFDRANMTEFIIKLKMMVHKDEALLVNLHEEKAKLESEKLTKSKEEKVCYLGCYLLIFFVI